MDRLLNTPTFFLFVILFHAQLSGKCQTAESIVQKHLQSTSNYSWLDLNSVYEEGKETTVYQTYRFKTFMKLPNLIRSELDYGNRTSLVVMNGDDDELLMKLGFSRPLPLMNHSHSLIKKELYGLFFSSKSDTLIDGTLFHRIKVTQTSGDFRSNSIYFFDDINFYLTRIDCIDPQYVSSIEFSDFRRVEGYVFAFTSRIKKFGKDHSTRTIDLIRVNEEFKSGTFDSQRE
jgi:hypothetical protein